MFVGDLSEVFHDIGTETKRIYVQSARLRIKQRTRVKISDY